MISNIVIKNFKSLYNFELKDIQKFNCFIGLNGSGKTTLLQAFDFLSQLMRGDMEGWLKKRTWKNTELRSFNSSSILVTFEIDIKIEESRIVWKGDYNPIKNYCTNEEVLINDKIKLKVESGKYSLEENAKNSINFDYSGSIMSQLKTNSNPINSLKKEIIELKSLELLSPSNMHGGSRGDADDVGIYGEKIHHFLFSLKKTHKNEFNQLFEELKKFYPKLLTLDTQSKKFGWKRIFIEEVYKTKTKTKTNSNHINDGFLRILAIIAQTFGEYNTLLFDEIENGINPELIEKLVDFLVKSEKQIFITTHSPLVLNYIDDETAKKSIYLLYKNSDGNTKSAKYFDYPEAKRKLDFFGPGEVYVDTSISDAVDHFTKSEK